MHISIMIWLLSSKYEFNITATQLEIPAKSQLRLHAVVHFKGTLKFVNWGFCVFTGDKKRMAGLNYHQRKTAGMQKLNICLSTLNNADSRSSC